MIGNFWKTFGVINCIVHVVGYGNVTDQGDGIYHMFLRIACILEIFDNGIINFSTVFDYALGKLGQSVKFVIKRSFSRPDFQNLVFVETFLLRNHTVGGLAIGTSYEKGLSKFVIRKAAMLIVGKMVFRLQKKQTV